jgi:hypothetical protein
MCAQEWLTAAVAAAARPLTNPAALLFPGDRLLLDGRPLDWQRRPTAAAAAAAVGRGRGCRWRERAV